MNIPAPAIHWDFGTAYEFFISLHVLHHPDHFGLRPSWAAGVRSRIPAVERKLLEDVFVLTGVPLGWIHKLPAPKDAACALLTLKQIPSAERLLKLQDVDAADLEDEKHRQFNETLLRIAAEGKWLAEDADFFMKVFGKRSVHPVKRDSLERALDWWSRPAELGEGFLSALQSYYMTFFEEEEKRIAPALKAGLEHAQLLAQDITVDALFAELSKGVQLGEEFQAPNIIFAPAFWSTPFIMFEKVDSGQSQIVIFGARPADMSIVPGEIVPDGLVHSLKALADPTRLKILFYLSQESLTPTELARRLQLRPPTVIHHLNELRIATLVELSTDKGDKRYAVRRQALDSTFELLRSFLNTPGAAPLK